MTDEELVEAFVETGDSEAMTELLGRYSGKLRRLLHTMLRGDLERVKDAEQDVYVRVIERLHTFRGDARFSTFLFSLARNRVLDVIRSETRRSRRSTTIEFPDRIQSDAATPEQTSARNSDAALLRRAMTVLSASDRFLLYMKDAEGESIAELAAVARMAEGTLKSRLSRARGRVRVRLEELGYEG